MTKDIKAYCKRKWPEEACGVVVDGQFIPCDNIAQNKVLNFEIDAEVFILHDVEAVVHSHPDDEPFLSPHDRHSQVASGLPWLLVTQGKLKKFPYMPLLRGREFLYGVYDCGTLIADAFALCGISIRYFKRDAINTDEQQNKLADSLPKCGFETVNGLANLQAGDVLLTSHGKNGNHLMLYLGNEQVIHHVYNRLSCVEFFGQKMQARVCSVWRHKKWQLGMIEAIHNDLKAYEI